MQQASEQFFGKEYPLQIRLFYVSNCPICNPWN